MRPERKKQSAADWRRQHRAALDDLWQAQAELAHERHLAAGRLGLLYQALRELAPLREFARLVLGKGLISVRSDRLGHTDDTRVSWLDGHPNSTDCHNELAEAILKETGHDN